MTSYGASYLKYSTDFTTGSHPVNFSSVTPLTAIYTLTLIILAFGSLSLAFIGKSKSPITFIFYALIASLSIGYGSISVSNYVGVYI
ncbi:uncharacterized protein RJT21DRAFT_120291 [Scheffersomyces amazonensis]|uniref:uncharacterized protein n=1 Tax=Scheffersomyces amazonensis TaxID=1078765 RepID=UPI00315D8CD1